MNDPKFWLSAIARGGSFGPLGDFLFSDKSRHGHGFIASLAGPLAGTIEQGVKLTVGNVQKLFAGEDTSVARDLVRFFEGFLPGNSLWYTRLAIERFLKDQLLLLTDPDIKSKWRRAETKARREFGQRYWWRRGRARPDRSPVLSQAPG